MAERLQADPQTSTIPVHVISVRDQPQMTQQHGVASYLTKPADLATLEHMFAEVTANLTPPIRALLLIESDPEKRAAIVAVLARADRLLDTVATAGEALEALRQRQYQGMVIELDLPGQDGLTLLGQIRADPQIAPVPAVLYSERALDAAAIARIHQLDARVGDGDSALAVVAAEVPGFLQRVHVALPPEQVQPRAHEPDSEALDALRGRCVLIVDDDARNLFALTGLLESHGMLVAAVDSGEQALRELAARTDIDIVLMDIMMPDMDGYETIRRVRAEPRFASLPIIALTAKAMLEERSKCIEAGASDYASKPVDTEQLLGQLCMWLA